MKRYGVSCGPLNDCGEPAGAGWACECDGQGHCTDWGVGGFAAGNLTGDELQAAFEASTTKFLVDKNNVLGEVGLLAGAGLQVGDRLVSVKGYNMARLEDRNRILEWNFTADTLKVGYVRDGKLYMSTLDNSKGIA